MFQARGDGCPLALVAAPVDFPNVAGTCEPLSLLPEKWARFVSDPSAMFPLLPDGLDKFNVFLRVFVSECVALMVRQLRCGKTLLRDSILAGGTVFPVGKSDGVHQREVWHGARISDVCAPPPAPRLLASPSAFCAVELPGAGLLGVTKRDARTYFDQLLLPTRLLPYMARPPVTVAQLVEAGMPIDEIRSHRAFASYQDNDIDRDVAHMPDRLWR